MIEKISKITGLIPIKYSELTEEQKLNNIFIHSPCLDNFTDEEIFHKVCHCTNLLKKIEEGYNHIIDQEVLQKQLHSFLEVPLGTNLSELKTFAQADTGQPIEKKRVVYV